MALPNLPKTLMGYPVVQVEGSILPEQPPQIVLASLDDCLATIGLERVNELLAIIARYKASLLKPPEERNDWHDARRLWSQLTSFFQKYEPKDETK